MMRRGYHVGCVHPCVMAQSRRYSCEYECAAWRNGASCSWMTQGCTCPSVPDRSELVQVASCISLYELGFCYGFWPYLLTCCVETSSTAKTALIGLAWVCRCEQIHHAQHGELANGQKLNRQSRTPSRHYLSLTQTIVHRGGSHTSSISLR